MAHINYYARRVAYFRARYLANREAYLAERRAYYAANADAIRVARKLGCSRADARALLRDAAARRRGKRSAQSTGDLDRPVDGR